MSFATLVRAQDVHATARVDSNKVTIGDWLQLRIEIEHPSNVTVTIPSLADSLEGMEIVKRDSEIVKQNGSTILRAMTFTITSFDSGTHVIPPLTIHYSSVGDTTKRVVETSPVPIFVRGIAVDTSKEIRDIKAPQSVPMTFADVLPYIVGVVLLAGLVWLFFYIRKKRKLGERIIPETPPRPPHEVALEALRSLESEKLWQRGKVKEYHSSLTDIIRTYIERRFKVMAMESTSDEILHSLRLSIRSNDVYEKLKEMLLCADLVKFAKYQPDANDHEASLADAFAFVEATWKEYAEPAKQMEGAEVKP
ncbi:MAG: hypothetical protein HY033_05595 [Ignavibacteriae bacterium]|nr:hypothetical protein [Ignavibacteriota bacterium]